VRKEAAAAAALACAALLLAPGLASARDPDGDYRRDVTDVAGLVDQAIRAARTAVTSGTFGEISDREVAHQLRLQAAALEDAGAQLAGVQPPPSGATGQGRLEAAVREYGGALQELEKCYRTERDALCDESYARIDAAERLRQDALAELHLDNGFAYSNASETSSPS
jgi:hypothetical protein